jgi:hypothetical protein
LQIRAIGINSKLAEDTRFRLFRNFTWPRSVSDILNRASTKIDTMDIMLLFLALLAFLLLIGTPILIGFIIYKWLKRKGYKKLGISILCVIILSLSYMFYTALYPTDDFYFEEFKQVTLREIPNSAEIMEKSCSYPDFHGDYCSSSQVKLSKEDYLKLLREMENDNRLTKTTQMNGFQEFSNTIGGKKESNIIKGFTRVIVGEEDQYLYIGFYNDNETIFVNVCVT